MNAPINKTAAQLRKELAEAETLEEGERNLRLWSLVEHLSREDKQVLRNLLNDNIKATYDADDE